MIPEFIDCMLSISIGVSAGIGFFCWFVKDYKWFNISGAVLLALLLTLGAKKHFDQEMNAQNFILERIAVSLEKQEVNKTTTEETK